MSRKYQICTQCVMDTTDTEIVFDENGVCSHCHEYEKRKKKFITDPLQREKALQGIIQKIKDAGKGKKYDCIVGISGGVDSSYVAYLAKHYELKALLVHLDNGWDSELAVKNIEKIVNYTGFDLFTLVVNWEEFKDLQQAFFKADVVDLELLSDHAISSTVYKLTRQYNINYLLSGENFETEAIMPRSWNWRKSDATNIKAIHKLFGKVKLKTFPFMSTLKKLFYDKTFTAQSINILDYIDYNKEKVMKILESEIGWKYYGGKHYESIFTRFYQGYILPKKFNIDKRKAHHSTLINSKQITREDAIDDLNNDIYPIRLQQEDFELVCKKLDFIQEELQEYIKRPAINHDFYKTDKYLIENIRKINNIFKYINRIFTKNKLL
ncbi:N-acetyl sugar amidotransferase [Arcobacter lacus]|uniref:N-acetyl sugar amidotransferase n=1 Tax=Arcobacter lacus TaxID=1912876 RepID=UPI0021BAF0EB|nr:N-acetyl sugar amidotransferase [Arcobacter lacus]MCG3714141.1 N-acetyl sugar amidotransferase [Aliarcobacter butzleri]MCT7908121.1 N-acetyl sugar amidotransferase [Arcobacter lacus]